MDGRPVSLSIAFPAKSSRIRLGTVLQTSQPTTPVVSMILKYSAQPVNHCLMFASTPEENCK